VNPVRSIFFCAALLLTFASALYGAPTSGGKAAKAAKARNVLYTCACGPTCQCTTATTAAGQCSCGKPLKWNHVLKVEGSVALVCSCAEGCTCAMDPQNGTQCGCGQEVKRVELKGTGLYFCNCGGSCACNTVATKPGKCGCGMALKRAE
jgi:hypothetical protein